MKKGNFFTCDDEIYKRRDELERVETWERMKQSSFSLGYS